MRENIDALIFKKNILRDRLRQNLYVSREILFISNHFSANEDRPAITAQYIIQTSSYIHQSIPASFTELE